jgi:hypothetical protein
MIAAEVNSAAGADTSLVDSLDMSLNEFTLSEKIVSLHEEVLK